MYDDSDDAMQVPQVRQRMDSAGIRQAETMPKLSPGEVGCSIDVVTQDEAPSKDGCVYFIETHDSAFVKIGYSANAVHRFKTISPLMPGLRLIGYMPGTYATERWLHQKFAAVRVSGEWFRYAEDMRAFVIGLGLITPIAHEERSPVLKRIAKERKAALKEERHRAVKESTRLVRERKAPPNPISEYLAEIGRRGGEVKGGKPKGFAAMDAERRSEIAKKAIAKRWGKKAK